MNAKDVYSAIITYLGKDGKSSRIGPREIIAAVKEASGELITSTWAKTNNGKLIPSDKITESFIIAISKSKITYRLSDMLQGTSENCSLFKPNSNGLYNENDYPYGIELPEDFKMPYSIVTTTTNNPNIILTYENDVDYTITPDVKDEIGTIIRFNVPTKHTTPDEYVNDIFYNTLLRPYDNLTYLVFTPADVNTAIDSNGKPLVKGTYDFRSAKYGPYYYINNDNAAGNVLPKGKFYGENKKMAWVISGEGQYPIKVDITYIRTHLPFHIDLTNPDLNIDLPVSDDIVNIIIDRALVILNSKLVPDEGLYQTSNNEDSKNQTRN